MSSAVWPAPTDWSSRAPVTAAYLFATCVLSVFVAKRITTFAALRTLSLARALVVLVLVESLLFILVSSFLVLGVGTSESLLACQLGILWCIIFYASSKVAIYAFLMERVHLVHGNTSRGRVTRMRSRWYQVGFVFFVLWVTVTVTLAVGRISLIRAQDGACVIGLHPWASIPLLAMDLLVNVFLTSAFVVPIWGRLKLSSAPVGKAQRLARNSVLAAICALITSFANMLTLTLRHGHELSWVCLGTCGIDVFLNACIIYIITSHDNGSNRTGHSSSVKPPAWSGRRERDEATSAWSRREEGQGVPLAKSTPGYFPECEDDITLPTPVMFSGLIGGVRREDGRRGRGSGEGHRPRRWSGIDVSREVVVEVEPPIDVRLDGLEEEEGEGEKGSSENEVVDWEVLDV